MNSRTYALNQMDMVTENANLIANLHTIDSGLPRKVLNYTWMVLWNACFAFGNGRLAVEEVREEEGRQAA